MWTQTRAPLVHTSTASARWIDELERLAHLHPLNIVDFVNDMHYSVK
jgi:hypothetical protein